MWKFLIFHVSEHIWTLFTISGKSNAISDRFKWDFPHYLTMCAGGLLWRSSRNSQPGGEANLTQVAAQLSRRDSSEGGVGGGGVRCLSTVQRRTLINILEAKAEAWDTQRDRERKGGGGAEQDSPAFLSSLVSDCTDAGHLNAAAAANTWQPDVWISEDNACY